MGLKNQVQTQLENYAKDYANLENLTGKDYDTAWDSIVSKYNLLLDDNQVAKGVQDELDFSDLSSVKKRMLLNARRDRRYAKQEQLSNAVPDIAKEGFSQLVNTINAFGQPDPNSQSAAALSEQIDRNAKINAEQFAQKQAAWEEQALRAQQSMKMSLQKQAIPGQGIPSGESQLAKQGMKINYMTLFK